MICLSGNLPALKIGHQHVIGYHTDWIQEALQRAAAACDLKDCPFLEDLSEGILYYLEKRCSLRVFAIEDLYARMRKMLRKIGYPEIAQHLSPLAPPVTVSLIGPALDAGPKNLGAFFKILLEEISLLQEDGAELINFCDINARIEILLGQCSETSRARLKDEISAFLENYRQLHQQPKFEFSVTLDS